MSNRPALKFKITNKEDLSDIRDIGVAWFATKGRDGPRIENCFTVTLGVKPYGDREGLSIEEVCELLATGDWYISAWLDDTDGGAREQIEQMDAW